MTLVNGTTIGLRSISTVETTSANGHSGVTILGSAGNDVLNFTVVTLVDIVSIDGGGGNDSITGSAGPDVIIGRAGGRSCSDHLRSWHRTRQRRRLPVLRRLRRGLGITAATFAGSVSNTAGNNTVITIAGQGTIRLSGVTGANIDITDFILAP